MTAGELGQRFEAARRGGPDEMRALAGACGSIEDGREDLAPLLLRMLVDPNVAAVREDVVEALGRAGARQAGPALLAMLDTDEHWLRVKAIAALGRVRCHDAVTALREVLARDSRECWHTRSEAIEALVALGARDAAVELTAALTDTAEDPDVRIAAAEALADLAIDDAAVPLRMTAAREKDTEVGATARAALMRLPPRYAPDRALPERAYLPGVTPRPPEQAATSGTDDERHRWAVDLYNRGFAWEAHEVWEAVWNDCRARGDQAHAAQFQGLILCAAAAIKNRLGQRRAARGLLERAAVKLGDTGLRDQLAEDHPPRALPPTF